MWTSFGVHSVELPGDTGETNVEAMNKIGLIAGGGQFPILFARAARSQGVHVVAVLIRGEADKLLEAEVEVYTWVSLGKLGQMIEIFQKARVSEAAMAGTVAKTKLYSRIRPDWRLSMWVWTSSM